MTSMTAEQAGEVYDILIKEAQAPGGDWRYSFILEFTSAKPTNEWRFGGSLGFGGKFRFPRLSVDCYPEDETPERRATIERTNEALARWKAGALKA